MMEKLSIILRNEGLAIKGKIFYLCNVFSIEGKKQIAALKKPILSNGLQ